MRALRCSISLLLAAAALSAAEVTITILATTDLHGNIYPYDYYTAKPASRGLAKVASILRAEREGNANTLLVDCGDTIQGSPLEYVYQQFIRTGRWPLGLVMSGEALSEEPMMRAMNAIGYQALVLGNHDFNFGLKNLDNARAAARFPWLSANTVLEPGSGRKPFERYILKTVAGVKVAVIGLTTPNIPQWDPPENYKGYQFRPIWETAREVVKEVREKEGAELVLLAVHDGIQKNSKIRIPAGVDAIVYGHSHQQAAGYRIGDVLLVEPRNWAMSVAKIEFVFETGAGGARLIDKRSRLLPVNEKTPAAPDILKLGEPYHQVAEKYLNTPVTKAPKRLDGRLGRIEDTPLVDAIQAVQMHYARADVSFTGLFHPDVAILKGPVSVRQLAALYIYDNELYAIEGNGKMVGEALENASRYFRSCPDQTCANGPLINRAVAGFNYDMAQGVSYQIDLREPAGHRIKNLRWKGRPLADDQQLRIALNNYRAGGSGGYRMFGGAKVVWQSSQDIRDLMIQYYGQSKSLPAKADRNWRIVPPAAQKTLAKEVAAEAGRPEDR